MADLHFTLVTPERQMMSDDVHMVVVPGTEGEFGVMAGHAPFMTTLAEGEVTVLDGNTRRVFAIRGGFADVTGDGFTILAEHATEAA